MRPAALGNAVPSVELFLLGGQGSGTASVSLTEALSKIKIPTLILQPQIEPETFRESVLTNIGMTSNDKKFIPKMSGLRPDVIFADDRREIEFEILPDGTRRQLVDGDKRMVTVDDENRLPQPYIRYGLYGLVAEV